MKNTMIEKMYDTFSQIPFFWEIDAITCRATEHSSYRSTLIENLSLSEGSRVLDVACGTGLNFHLLESKIGNHGRISGIDNSEKTLALARKRVTRQTWNNVDLTKVDASHYQEDSGFDAALCTFAIEIIPPYMETIKTMIKSVKTHGRIGFIGFKYSERSFFKLFNAAFKWSGVLFGGVDLNRRIPEYLRENLNEIFFKDVFGGFYYIAVYEKQ